MRKTIFFWMLMAITTGLLSRSASAQSGAKNGEWRTYGGDLGNTHYSPLDQINASNFSKLTVAWAFKTDNGSKAGIPVRGDAAHGKRCSLFDRRNAARRDCARSCNGRAN